MDLENIETFDKNKSSVNNFVTDNRQTTTLLSRKEQRVHQVNHLINEYKYGIKQGLKKGTGFN